MNRSVERVHILVSGMVQGVCFRASARERARALGLTGVVRNLSDGRVEIIAEGPKDKLDALSRWARRGPPGARVEDATAAWARPTGEYSSFLIAHDA
jgi:acylphosphatase